jgi:hypothetical protein
MTPIQTYIESLKNYKKSGGNIDDAIILAETILIEIEKKHITDAYKKGSDEADAHWAIGKKSLTATEFYNLKYTNNDSTPTT